MYEKKNPNTIWYLIIGVVVLTLVMLVIHMESLIR